MAVLNKNRVTVYNTRTSKEYMIHPDMARDPQWMAARGLIIQDKVKPFEATNMPEAGTEPSPDPKAVKPKTTK